MFIQIVIMTIRNINGFLSGIGSRRRNHFFITDTNFGNIAQFIYIFELSPLPTQNDINWFEQSINK